MNSLIKSQNGSVFGAIVTKESDGSVSILTNDGKGYRSAHRGHAKSLLGSKRLTCTSRLTWINMDGARVVSTTWKAA